MRKPLTVLLVTVLLGTLTAAMPMAGGPEDDVVPTSGPWDEPIPNDFDDPIPNPMTGTRPLVVVLLEYSDLAHNAALTPTFMQNQFFGPRPSVNDFWIEQSYGQFQFSDEGNWVWITAYDDPATTPNATSNNDESTWEFWSNFSDPVFRGGIFFEWALRSLDEAGYDFAPLDVDGDGTVTFGWEVAYIVVGAAPPGSRGGAMRGMPGSFTFDGKPIVGVGSGVPADSPWITLYAHEIAHQTSWGGPWFLTDYYGIIPEIIGMFSLMGFSGTGGWAGPIGPHHLDAPSKLKLGWVTPTVVSADGFYDIADAETNAVQYLLHDPANGKHEYFLVENRWKGTSYDNTDALIPAMTAPLPPANAAIDIPDEGLLIWHVDETRGWNGSTTGGFATVDLIRRGGSDNNAAFNGADGAYYDFWDGSSPENANWNGGANSKTGVWCVSPASATMRAWLDVPGPGVLICTDPPSANAIPGSSGTIDVPLRNTGDATDTFAVTVSAPGDVTVTLPAPVVIAAKAEVTVSVQLTPIRACTTAPGPRAVTITATSTTDATVTSSVPATLTVLPFGEPDASLATLVGSVEPGNAGTFSVAITNDGNALDTYSLSFAGLDFGTAYRADPTAIPSSWVSFTPSGPSAPACGVTATTLTIDVPMDWAGMEDATYDFLVTATSSITPDDDAVGGQFTVEATPLSMMLYVKKEIQDLIDMVSALPPSDVRDGLLDKATGALAKVEQAIDRYLLGDDPPASNLFGTTQNKLKAFLNQVSAQRGKALTDAQADALAALATLIRADIDLILAAI